MQALTPVITVQLHRVVFMENSDGLVLCDGRYFNLRQAGLLDLDIADELVFSAPLQPLAFSLAMHLRRAARRCLQLAKDPSARLLPAAWGQAPVFSCYKPPDNLITDTVLEQLTFCTRLLATEIREGRCGPVEVTFV